MKFKKYLKPFWRTVQSGEQIVQRRRKFGFLSGRRALLPWLNAGKPLGLLHFLIPVAVVLIPTAIVLTQVPSLRLAAFQFSKGALFESKPKPITQSSIPLPLDVQSAIQNLASQQIKQEQANAILAVNNSLVPTSQNGLIQPLVDSVQETLTTNPIDKAKLRLKNIDRQIVELQMLLNKDKSDQAVDRAVNLIKTIGQETGQVVSDPKTQSDREVLTTLIQQYNRLQLVIQKIEDQLPVALFLKIEAARETYLEKGAQDSLNNAPNLEVVNNIGLKEVAKIVGNDFAELKAIEILTDLQTGLQPETKLKLAGIQKQLAVQFEKKMLKLPPDVRERKLQNYINYSYGNPLRQAESFEQMKQFLKDRGMVLAVDSLKELALHRLEDRVFEINDQNTLNQFFDTTFQNSSDLKILAQLKLDVLAGRDEVKKKKIADLEQNSKAKIIEKFGQAGNLSAFFTQDASASADLLDVSAVNQLATILNDSPQVGVDVKNTIKTIKQKVLQDFIASISKKDFTTQAKAGYNPVSPSSDVRLLLVDPQAIGLLEEIKKELPAKDQGKIAIAQKAAIGLLADHVLLHINDPDVFKEHEQLISDNPQLKQLISAQLGQRFFTNLAKKKQLLDKQSKENQQALYQKMQQIVQAIFVGSGRVGLESQLPQNVQDEVDKFKSSLPDNNVPKLITPEGVTLGEVAKLPGDVNAAIIQAAKQEIKDKAESELAKLDLTVRAKDLGVSEPTILPDNLLYPVIEVVREIPVLLATNPVDKAEKQLKIDNERTLEAAKLLENSQSQETVSQSLAVLDKINQDFELLKAHVDELKKEDPAKVDQLVNQIIENGVARQTVLSSIENKVYGDDYVKVEIDRQAVLKKGVDVLLDLTNQDAQKLTDKLAAAVQNSQGSELKDIKAIELLTEISRTEPEPIKQVLKNSEASLAQDLETKLLAMPKEQRTQEVLAYAENAPGNPVRQFEAYDTLKSDFKNPEIITLAEGLKDKAAENLTEKVSEITDASSRQQFVDAVVGNQPQDLKIAVEIEQRVTPPQTSVSETLPIVEKVQDIKANIEQNIVETFKDKPVELAKTDFYQNATASATVNITDVKVAADLTEVLSRSPEVSSDVIIIAKQEEKQIVNTLVENISKPEFQVVTNTQTASSSASTQVVVTPLAAEILNPVPETIAELVDLKSKVPVSEQAKIDVAIKVEVKLVEDHLVNQVNDPVIFQDYVAQIEGNPVVAQTITQVGGTQFTQVLDSKAQEIQTITTKQQTTLETTVAALQQEVFSAPISNPSPVEQTLPQSVQQEIQQIKQELPKEQIPQVEVATIVTVLPAVPAATTQPSNVPASTSPQPTTESVSVPATAPAPATEVKPPDQPVVAPQNPPVVPGL